MTSNSTKSPTLQLEAETTVRLLDDWFDPIEAARAVGCANSSKR